MVRDEVFARELFYSQADPADPWYELPYWEGFVPLQACGMIAYAMCASVLHGRRIDPLEVYERRKAAGLDQLHQFEKGTNRICGGDAHPSLNEINTKLFGTRSALMERTVEDFKRVLAEEDTVIWCSTRGYDLHNCQGEKYHRHPSFGHVVCVWKYEDGLFNFKDCHYKTPEEGNNVPYTEEELAEYLEAFNYQHFAIKLCSE